ncbi:MAG: OmpP1/FadL family transporter [Luteibaculaceae bacterium]
MYKGKILWSAIITIAGSLSLFAQSDFDVIRYSFLNPTATARATALGGAVGSMGNDPTVLSTNPGGLGITRTSQFMITPMLAATTTNTSHLGQNAADFSSNFALGNFSYVTSSRTENDRGVVRINYGVSLNRIANFDREFTVNGRVPNADQNAQNIRNGQYVNRFLDFANGTPPQGLRNFFDGPAFDVGVIDLIPGEDRFYESLFAPETDINQEQRIRERRGISDISFGAALNINENIFLGASLGILNLNYRTTINVNESVVTTAFTDAEFPLLAYSFREEIGARGSAFNLKLGGVFKINDNLRLGAAWHSGTVFEMREDFSTSFSSELIDGNFNASSGPGTFNYRVRIPGRLIGSATVIFGKYGLLNVEYERVNFQNGELRPSRLEPFNTGIFDGPDSPNENMREFYQPGNVFRLGTEIRVYGPVFARAGYVLMETPVRQNFRTFEGDRQIFSGGLGMNLKKFSIDFTYFRSEMTQDHFMYAPAVPVTSLNTVVDGFLLSLGFRLGR